MGIFSKKRDNGEFSPKDIEKEGENPVPDPEMNVKPNKAKIGRPSNAEKEKKERKKSLSIKIGDQFDNFNDKLKDTNYGDMSAGKWERDAIVDVCADEMSENNIDISPRTLVAIALVSWGCRAGFNYWIKSKRDEGLDEVEEENDIQDDKKVSDS